MVNVLVTGCSGFVASHLIDRLLLDGFKVYGTLRVAYTTRNIQVPRDTTVIVSDLLDPHSLKKAVRLAQPEYVFHLAALSPVMYSFENPMNYVQTNFIGTCNLIDACLELPVLKRFILASSAEVYGEQNAKLLTEEDPFSSRNTPYGLTKICADYWTRMTGEVYGLPYTINRSTNMYGPRTRHRVAEKIVQSMLTKDKVTMDGRPDVVRDFMYVKDGVEGYMRCMDSKAENEVFNFSTGVGTRIDELVEICREIIGFKGEVVFASAPRPKDPKSLVLSFEKAKRILGWQPKYSLKQGLSETIKWWMEELGKA
jgi:nucleoside-diphosphate-sugar epimerase